MSEETIEKREALLWMDIETTGLDPERDKMLEVEMWVTDMRAADEDDLLHLVLPVGDRLSISREALAMHMHNGLIDTVMRTSSDTWTESLDDLRSFVSDASFRFVLHPAGSSVHFDMDFLGRLLPGLFDGCHHRRLDVSSLRMSFEAAGVALPEQEPTDHRTSTCLERDIAQYRTMLDMLAGLRAPSDVDGVMRGE